MNNRTPKYLSPSALACWETNPDEAFTRYIVPKELRPARPPQTSPMSVGSAFDALVKAELSEQFFGREQTKATGYRRRDLIVKQCEQHTLPESLVVACDVFDQYLRCGAYGNLVNLISGSAVDCRMEFDVTKRVGGVPMLGKPDLHFHSPTGAHVITDWKVSGSVSKHGVSPQQGYMTALDCQESATHGKAHKKFVPSEVGGIVVNGVPMNETTDYWADQLSTYAWCLGEQVGDEDFIARIEQMACRTTKQGELRVKSVVHQSFVDGNYQQDLLRRYQRCWHGVETGHYFQDCTRAQSDARADLIMRQLQQPVDPSKLTIGDVPTIDWS